MLFAPGQKHQQPPVTSPATTTQTWKLEASSAVIEYS